MGLPAHLRDELLRELPHFQILVTELGAHHKAYLESVLKTCDLPTFVLGQEDTALLFGCRRQFDQLIAAIPQDGELDQLRSALCAATTAVDVPLPARIGSRTFVFGQRTYLMGVVNVTPDSFSDGGRFLDPKAAIAQGEALVRAGADLIDVGGESTRPGAASVPVDEELIRVLPVVRELVKRIDVPISIDTTKADVAQQAIDSGATMVNDISGFKFDSALAGVVAKTGVACCLMHTRGTPDVMQMQPHYDDVVAEVAECLSESIQRALEAGVTKGQIFVDPGIGFGKTVGHNLFLLRRLIDFRVLGFPILVGTSRKSFLGHLVGGKPPSERVFATVGSVAALAATFGADIVRVHDVAEVKDALMVADAIKSANEGGERWRPK